MARAVAPTTNPPAFTISRLSIRLPQSDKYAELSKRLAGLGARERSAWIRKALLLMLEEEQSPLRQQMQDALAEYKQGQEELLTIIKQLQQSGASPSEPVAKVGGRKVNLSKLKKLVDV